jgi:hypothetical protein
MTMHKIMCTALLSLCFTGQSLTMKRDCPSQSTEQKDKRSKIKKQYPYILFLLGFEDDPTECYATVQKVSAHNMNAQNLNLQDLVKKDFFEVGPISREHNHHLVMALYHATEKKQRTKVQYDLNQNAAMYSFLQHKNLVAVFAPQKYELTIKPLTKNTQVAVKVREFKVEESKKYRLETVYDRFNNERIAAQFFVKDKE